MLNGLQQKWCDEKPADYSDLSVLFLNCTLKLSPEMSHTEGLINLSMEILQKNNVACEVIRPVDHDLAFGVYPDMTEKGWKTDEWPRLYSKVKQADILVLCTPIWLGEKSSVCQKVIERLYASSGDLNDKGQYGY